MCLKTKKEFCRIENCKKTIFVNGICSMHYSRIRRHGSAEKPKSKKEELIQRGLSYCPRCNKKKPLSAFNKDIHAFFNIAIYCRECNKNKSKLQYREHKSSHKNCQLKYDYDITLEQYNKILTKQENKCAICGEVGNGNIMMCVDHCHAKNKVRGLLCRACNLGLGYFKDSIELLSNAINYLKGSQESNQQKDHSVVQREIPNVQCPNN